jgi:hypothetical protein
MLKYMIWQYRDDNNCWDYVRYWLINEFGVPEKEVPKFGAVVSKKDGDTALFSMTDEKMKAMTDGSCEVIKHCSESGPVNGAIACKYFGDYMYHVGIVIGGNVCHIGKSSTGVKCEPIDKFSRAGKTKYYAHRSIR